MLLLKLYLIFTLLPNLGLLSSIITLVDLTALIIIIFGISLTEGLLLKELKTIPKKIKIIIFSIFLICLFLSILIPSEESMIKIFGLNYITNINNIDKVPTNLVNKLNELLKEEK